jgi:hypothetical protein
MYGSGDRTFLGICLDRTLDEAYFPSIDASFFKTRNKDQVVSKEWHRIFRDAPIKEAPILLVPQLWIWRLDSVLLTAFPGETSRETKIFDMGEGIINPFCFFKEKPLLELQIGRTLADQIVKFGGSHDCGDGGPRFKSALHMFESAVLYALTEVQDYLNTGEAALPITEQKKREQTFIHTISDIHSELDMISSVLQQQKDVMKDFLEHTATTRISARGEDKKLWADVIEAQRSLGAYTDRVAKIHRDADRIDKTIESYLNLKRMYAVSKTHGTVSPSESQPQHLRS